MADVQEQPVRWFLEPHVPRAELTFIIGPPECGKSTFLAYLASLAERAIMLPGHEESLERMLVPRLRAQGVKPDRVLFLEGHNWTFPSAGVRLEKQAKAWKVDLIVVDPIDSYLDEGKAENDAQHIRACLECLASVANVTGAAVVAVRHPGKDPQNPCPGSRAWRAVPRRILQFCQDSSHPPRPFLHAMKDSLGHKPPDTFVLLVGNEKGKPKRFEWGAPMREQAAEVALSLPDRAERRKMELACRILKAALADGKQEVAYIMSLAQQANISGSTFHLAADHLEIKKEMDGFGKALKHFWEKPDKWPE